MATFDAKKLSSIHSFSVTENFAVFFFYPVVIEGSKLFEAVAVSFLPSTSCSPSFPVTAAVLTSHYLATAYVLPRNSFSPQNFHVFELLTELEGQQTDIYVVDLKTGEVSSAIVHCGPLY